MNLKENELRIGNYIEEPKGHLHRVERTSIESKRVRYGIPLTEEWLKKFGFKKEKGEVQTWWIDKYYSVSFWSSGAITLETSTVDGSTHELRTIKYVHQLQDLYFALTGQELQIVNPVANGD